MARRDTPVFAGGNGSRLKITVVLLRRQIAMLDRLAVSIRLRSGVAISRAEIIQALIAASLRKPGEVEETVFRQRRPMTKSRR